LPFYDFYYILDFRDNYWSIKMRFFAEPHDIGKNTIRLSAEDSDHIRSLRLRPDEHFIVCDGEGIDYVCRLGARKDDRLAEIIDKHQSLGEPTIDCSVYIAYAKGERLDYAVQKSVELGAREIVLYESKRCIAIPNNIPKKIQRLQKIALETAKLCRRGIIPKVSSAGEFDIMLGMAADCADLALFCYESEDDLHLKSVLEDYFPPNLAVKATEVKTVSIITGPEGGFEPAEVELAKTKDFHVVSLGKRILRSETAPAVALTAVMYQTFNL